MVRVTILVQLLLLFVLLKRSDGLQDELSGMENKECLLLQHEILVSQCHLIGFQYPIIMYITIQLELLLYCLCVVTEIQLYIVKCYVSGYYIVHVSALPRGYK
jgi:hypothetical protein